MSEALSPDVRTEDREAPGWQAAARPDLRHGMWTRLGDERVLGDGATEAVLGRLAERARTAAQAQGYATGWAEGQRAAQRRAAEVAEALAADEARRERARAQEHAEAVTALTHAAATLARASREIATQIGEQATDLAFEVTRTLVGHELSVEDDQSVIARVLAVLPQDPTTVVRLHPSVVTPETADALAEHGVQLLPDPTLARQDAVVETETTAVDLRVDQALDRLREVLS